MKKLFVILLLMLFAVPAFAGQFTETLISKTNLNGTTRTTSGDTYTGDCDRVAFFVLYDSKETTAGVTATVTASFSYDGVNWVPAYWSDNDTATPTRVTSKILTVDGAYYMWFSKDQAIPNMQVRVTMVNGAKYGGTVEAADVTVVTIKNK